MLYIPIYATIRLETRKEEPLKTLIQFRESGLRALDGKWGKAILAALIHSALFGGRITPSIELKFDAPPEFGNNINIELSIFDHFTTTDSTI